MTIFRAENIDLNVELPDDLALLAYRGSIAHGLHIPSTDPNSIDDIDLMGFVTGEIENYFGFSQWGGNTGTKEIKNGPYDVVLYELRKGIKLLIAGNPNVVSILWNNPRHYILKNHIGQWLLDNRDLFSGKHMYHSFAGYANGQLKRMESRDSAELSEYLNVTSELKARGAHPNHKGECFTIVESTGLECIDTETLLDKLKTYHKKGENLGYMGDKRKKLVLQFGYDTKNAAHLIRLLKMCKEFLNTGVMSVDRARDQEELLGIKKGGWKLEDVKQYASDLFRECRASYESSTLPEDPQTEKIEKELVKLLGKHFKLQGV